MATIYSEKAVKWGTPCAGGESRIMDRVQVTLRRWDYPNSFDAAADYVLETNVMVDGEIVIHDFTAFDPWQHTDAEMQRTAIAKFDQLLASHPTLNKRE
jgi:hypothetical protein